MRQANDRPACDERRRRRVSSALDAEEAERLRCANHDNARIRSAWKRRLAIDTRPASAKTWPGQQGSPNTG